MNVRILLAEDNELNRYLTTFMLERSGFTVLHAADGREALARAQSERPDLIIMDIQMPAMDGYEAAERIKAVPGLAHIPLVALTSYAMAGDREKALRAGFVSYLEKPISIETFISEITHFLPEKESAV